MEATLLSLRVSALLVEHLACPLSCQQIPGQRSTIEIWAWHVAGQGDPVPGTEGVRSLAGLEVAAGSACVALVPGNVARRYVLVGAYSLVGQTGWRVLPEG